MLKPGCSWVDCHKAAEAEVLKGMVKLGVLSPTANIPDLVEKRLGACFMPHGLGHLIGIDTHDVGGYLPGYPERQAGPGLKSLRTARLMEENMCMTVEPGCYFIDCNIDDALKKFGDVLNAEKLNSMRGSGGARLEDVIVITATGMINYTLCPRTIEEVEHVMAGGKWPPEKDVAPELRREGLLKLF